MSPQREIDQYSYYVAKLEDAKKRLEDAKAEMQAAEDNRQTIVRLAVKEGEMEQTDVARRLDVSPSTVGRLAEGTLRKWARNGGGSNG